MQKLNHALKTVLFILNLNLFKEKNVSEDLKHNCIHAVCVFIGTNVISAFQSFLNDGSVIFEEKNDVVHQNGAFFF